VCYRLYLASPLTLSEIRSMLPAGVVADLVPPATRETLLDLHPDARDVVTLTSGGCACDLLGQRLSDRVEDERRLRARYRQAGVPRAAVIRALERHRMGLGRRSRTRPSPQTLARFVVEHARNAGPALFLQELQTADDVTPAPAGAVVTRHAGGIPGTHDWLPPGTPVLVVP